MIDSHAHIYLNTFEIDINSILQRAKLNGVTKILMPAIDSTTHDAMLTLENKFSNECISMMGLHPCSVKENVQEELKLVEKHLQKRKFISIGEIGLDFYWDKTFIDKQYIAFETQINWAIQLNIPIVIHSRETTEECISILQKYKSKNLKGVFHCFSGTLKQAQQITDLGFYLGIGGTITYKNSTVKEFINKIELRKILLETDAPYLSPIPFRGKRNEPENLKLIAQKLAELYENSIEEVAQITTLNTNLLFGI